MNTDEMPVLPKLPFIIGDLLLIGAAVIIGMMAETPWSAEVLMAVVVCVVLGAAILVAPFLVDYGRREQAELSARQRELATLVALCNESATSAGIAAGSLESFLNDGREVNQTMSEEMESFREQVAELKNELAAADTKREALLKKQGDTGKLVGELKDLSLTVAGLSELLQELKEAQESFTKKLSSLAKEKPARKESAKSRAEKVETVAKPVEEELIAEAAEEEMGDAEEMQEEELIETDEAVGEADAESESEEDEEDKVSEEEDSVLEDAVEEEAESDELEEEAVDEISEEENTLIEEESEEVKDEEAPEEEAPPVIEKPKPKPKPKKKRDDNTAEFDLGLSSDMEEPKVKMSESSDGVTRVVVTAYIGIGNNLFLRGEGAGLSWDKGTPLRFISIGKWGWESNDMDAPANIKIYKNDEIECTSLGEVKLEPGHHHEMSAFF